MRTGNWATTHIISLNNYYGGNVVSIPFNTEKVNVTPVLSEFAVSGVDPSGSRHLTTHPSFVKVLNSGVGPVSASLSFDYMNLGSTDVSPGSGISCTKVFNFRIAGFDCNTSRVFGMKVWASDLSDFLCPEASRIIFATSGTWLQDFNFNVNTLLNTSYHMSDSLPSSQNLYRIDGASTIYLTNDDHVSEWIYAALAASGTSPLGEYGGSLSVPSGMTFRVTYNLDNIPLRD